MHVSVGRRAFACVVWLERGSAVGKCIVVRGLGFGVCLGVYLSLVAYLRKVSKKGLILVVS